MKPPTARTWVFVAVGAFAFLVLHVHFLLAWKTYYANFPWPGYGQAMESGLVPAFFTSSPRSLLISFIVLFTLPLVTLWFAAGRGWKAALALWAGVMLSSMLIWLATKQLREDSNMWPIDLVFLAFQTALPLFLGVATALLMQKVTRLVRGWVVETKTRRERA